MLAPEVVQTSGMDCGPATLACLLRGFGIRASYARLRDACQTDVDGTSVDSLQDVACLLGLDARQVMLPPGQAVTGSDGLPAIVITKGPGGLAHFVVAWRRHGPLLQVMDPAVGRRFVRTGRFEDELYVHEMALPAADTAGWDAVPVPGEPDLVTIRGAVLVRVAGRLAAPDVAALPADLRAALTVPDPPPGRTLWRWLRGLGRWRLAAAALIAVLAAAAMVGEAAVFRALLSLASAPGVAVAGLVALAAGLLVAEVALAALVSDSGRRLEGELRGTLLRRLPALPDRYVRSRPLSDLAERAHRLHRLRELPQLAAEALVLGTQLALIPLVIGLLDPRSALPAAVTAIASTAVGAALIPAQAERDLRLRHQVGALAIRYLDALSGAAVLRLHHAQSIVEGEHRDLLRRWAGAVRGVHRTAAAAELAQGAVGLAGVAWLLATAAGRVTDPAAYLLLAYWGVALPVLGQQLGALARRYPAYRSAAVRLLEPLATPGEDAQPQPPEDAAGPGVSVALRGVRVVAGGQPVLAVDGLTVAAGEAIAVVGRSGSGKSTLAGLLLGWHTPAAGDLRVGGAPLDPARLAWLRRHTAWVDPTVTLWNADLDANLGYASTAPVPPWVAAGVGLAAPGGAIGDGGRALPRDLAQLVRLGRAVAQRDVRLAVLDEPFRGLDRDRRRALLRQVPAWWPGATVLFVTHDVADTLDFARVLVLAGGEIVEDGVPESLAAQADSRYAALLRAELAAR